MRFSLATIALTPRGGRALADRHERQRVFQWAAGTGFEGIEVSPQWLDIVRLADDELRDVREDAAASGLSVSGVNVNRVLRRGPGSRERHLLLERAIGAAAILGAQVVTISLSLPLGGPPRPILRGCDVPQPERDDNVTFIRTLAEHAQTRGIALSLELHDDGLLDTAELCLEMRERVGAKNIGVNPDLGNLVRNNPTADWRAALRLLAPYANNWHVKNYRDGSPSPVWDGEIDYAKATTIMQTTGYRGWISIESYFGDVLDLQTKSLAYMKRLITADKPVPQPQGSAA